jgi:hypothetical protein
MTLPMPLPRIPKTVNAVLCGGALDGREMRVDPMFLKQDLVVEVPATETTAARTTRWASDGTTDSYGRYRFMEAKPA